MYRKRAKIEGMLDSREVATRLGLYHTHLRRLCSAGEFPAPDLVIGGPQGYRWFESTVAPWAALREAQMAINARRAELVRASQPTWGWRKAGLKSPPVKEQASA